jgi:hypothetical protein
VVILFSHSPSRKQAIKVLLVIIKDDLPIYHVSEFSEIPALLEANPELISVLILDQWIQQDDFMSQVMPLMDHYPKLRTLSLLDEEPKMGQSRLGTQHRFIVGNFDPGQFLEIVRELLMESIK